MAGPWEKFIAKDPSGNAIDLARPRIENADGSFSTERTIGIDVDGKYYNIPTIVNGKQLSEDEAVDAFMRGQNKPVGVFNSREEADNAAPARSEKIGEVRSGPWAKFAKPVETAAAPEKPAISTAEDVARSAATGLRGGLEAAAGAFGDVNDINKRAASWLLQKAGVGEETAETIGEATRFLNPATAFAPKTSEIQETITKPIAGDHYEPQTTLGEYTKTGAEFLPAAALGPGRAGTRLVTQALLPALGSETAGQLTEGTKAEPYARVAGALMGAGAPSAARRAITPFPASPQRQALVDALTREGVDVTAGQRTGNQRLRYAESELGGRAAEGAMERQGEQFTRAALQRAGINADRATPEVIDQAFNRIGQQFDDLAARNSIVPDQQLGRDLRTVLNDYTQSVGSGAKAPIVESTIRDIATDIQTAGALTGERYKELATRVRNAARNTSSPELREAMHGLRETLDDAMERSLSAVGSGDMAAWREVRNQYRNMLVLEQAATGAGENAAMGIISPSQLRNATIAKQGRRAYARGQGDFEELARAGEGVMKPLPNSGTAGRLNAQNLGTGVLSMLGAGGGAAVGGPLGAAFGAATGAAIPRASGALMMSRPGQAFLGNQMLAGGPGTDPRIAALAAALLANQDR